jgi:hypothetical protein
MDFRQVVKAITDSKGIIAAIVVVIGLVSGILGILKPWVENVGSGSSLAMSPPMVVQPPPDSEAGQIAFELMNKSDGKAVMKSFSLVVLDTGPSEEYKVVQVGAEVPVVAFKVRLRPDEDHYDLLARRFGGSQPIRSYEEGEVEAIVVEVTSTDPHWYRLQIHIEWYDVENPEEVFELASPELLIEFPQELRDPS